MVNLKPEVKLMSVNVDQLTDRDIREYKDDIARYQRSQRLFSRLGFIFLGLMLFFLILGIAGIVILAVNATTESVGSGIVAVSSLMMGFGFTFFSLFLVAMVTMFVLRGALFDRKIYNRERLIKQWEEKHVE
jgi:Zn-dependent protease with chaperone function